MGTRYKIVLVDDHILFRDGLKYILEQNEEVEIIAEASDGLEFLKIIGGLEPDVVLMDISMPKLNGIEATERAIMEYPDLRIIGLSMFGDEHYYMSMLQAGARGFILKESGYDELIMAIRKVMNGDNFFSNKILTSLIKSHAMQNHPPQKREEEVRLSKRELEVLRLICEGYSNKEIAEKINISQRTIEGNRSSLLSKTGTKDSLNLALYALKHNLLE
ncbi:MAG: response regulator [Bacteroidota bacterium]